MPNAYNSNSNNAANKLPVSMCSRGSATRSTQFWYTHLRPVLLQSTNKGIVKVTSVLKRTTRHKLSATSFQEVKHLLQVGRADIILCHCNAFLQNIIRTKPLEHIGVLYKHCY